MINFEYFVEKGEVKKVSINIGLGKSLKNKMLERAEYLLTLEINNKSCTVIFEEIYESIREGCDSLLALRGYKSYSHQASILYLKNFKIFTEADINKLDKFREKRNNSKYYAKEILIDDAEDIKRFYLYFKDKFLKTFDKVINNEKV